MNVLRVCAVCQRTSRTLSLQAVGRFVWCLRCRESLISLTAPPSGQRPHILFSQTRLLPLATLYDYRDSFRELVLRGKLQQDWSVVHILRALIQTNTVAHQHLQWANCLVPAPASLWSRVRGRIDLAAGVAGELAQQYSLRLLTAPLQLHWRLRKRSLISRHTRQTQTESSAKDRSWLKEWFFIVEKSLWFWGLSHQRNDEIRCLIIDDVVTTGHTLEGIATVLRRVDSTIQLRALVFGDARRF